MLRVEIAKLLEEAKRITVEADRHIPDPSHTCGGCGGTRYADFAHHNMKEALSGAIGRLERTAEQLRRLGGDAGEAFEKLPKDHHGTAQA